MASGSRLLISSSMLLALLFACTGTQVCHCDAYGRVEDEVPKVYIVYMGAADENHSHLLSNRHSQMLASASNRSVESAMETIVYSYNRAINGFAAEMLPSQASILRKMPGVVSVFEDKTVLLQTTRSMNFLGLEDAFGQNTASSLWRRTRGEDIIVGILDSGVWPESASFSDAALPNYIPTKWRGSCLSSTLFQCNRKVIGARYYNAPGGSSTSPRDTTGHGSHVASIAAGAYAAAASEEGLAKGTAKGVAPQARIAVYKICWQKGSCGGSTILKGWDDAIGDGVDVINYSVGSTSDDYSKDIASIGSFHAIRKGIVAVAAAGNSGPANSTVDNTSPWVMTVAASSIDRAFQSNVVLGDGSTYLGSSIASFNLQNKYYTIVYGGSIPASPSTSAISAGACSPKALDPAKAKGKILLCDPPEVSPDAQANATRDYGAIAFIMGNNAAGMERLLGLHFSTPGTQVGNKAAEAIRSYTRTNRNPTATIQTPTTVTGQKPYPVMGIFSSKGPNPIVPDILKPDVTAPGVNILAAWSEDAAQAPPKKYNLESGTSMASPHVAGISALLKSLHPDWSPAAIKSSIMTTAYTRDSTGNPILDGDFAAAGPFNYGSGHVNPAAAADPGLVYDATEQDYTNFLCNIGFTPLQINAIIGNAVVCPPRGRASDLNYPSVTITKLAIAASVTRTLTSVSNSPSTYRIAITAPQGISVTANTTSLTFGKIGEKKAFTLRFVVNPGTFLRNQYVYGEYTWSDGTHTVRSPIVVNAVSSISSSALVSDT